MVLDCMLQLASKTSNDDNSWLFGAAKYSRISCFLVLKYIWVTTLHVCAFTHFPKCYLCHLEWINYRALVAGVSSMDLHHFKVFFQTIEMNLKSTNLRQCFNFTVFISTNPLNKNFIEEHFWNSFFSYACSVLLKTDLDPVLSKLCISFFS